MALLKIALVLMVLATGCYSPELGDCSVTCTTDEECAGDQVCTAQGMCAGAANACENTGAVPDAGAMPRMITLRVTIAGNGRVAVAGTECVRMEGPMGDRCELQVPAGPLLLEAIPDRTDKPFERWQSIVCAGQDASCQVTLVIDASVAAKFK